MGYRNRGRVFAAPRDDERTSIGDRHVEDAIEHLNKTCAATIATMTNYDISLEHTLPMLFRDSDLDRLRDAYGLVTPSATSLAYTLSEGVNLWVDCDGINILPPKASRLAPQLDRIAPLRKFISEVRAIHLRFEEVKAVLKWFNRNATPGAVRFYFPTAMKLCPSSPIWADLQEVPTRYSIPPDIGHWLPLVKEAATTVASSLLLPTTAVPKSRERMWLTFTEVKIPVTVPPYPHLVYKTDMLTYNI